MQFVELKTPPEVEHTALYEIKPKESLTSEKRTNGRLDSVCFILRYPASGPYLTPFIQFLWDKGVPITLITTGMGREHIRNMFGQTENPQIQSLLTIPNPQWVILTADEPVAFEQKWITIMQRRNPNLLTCVAEQRPGSAESMIAMLQQQDTSGMKWPTVTLAPTKDESDHLDKTYHLNNASTRHHVFPIGNPLYNFLTKDYESMRANYRHKIFELLNIPLAETQNHKIITYAGIPESDFPDLRQTPDATPQDLNSVVLQIALTGLAEQARQKSDTQFHFLYRPHPRATVQDLTHPVLKEFLNIPNLHITLQSTRDEKWHDFKDFRTLCAVSDVVINSLATIGEEIALVQTQLQDSPRLIVILPSDYEIDFASAKASGLRNIHSEIFIERSASAMHTLQNMHVPGFITKPDEISPAFAHAFNPEPLKSVKGLNHQLRMSQQARTDVPSARFYWWLRSKSRVTRPESAIHT